ncbi:MAG: aspartate aminotransferase family protein [Rhizobiaceae bacterium]
MNAPNSSLYGTFARAKLRFVKGEGSWLIDEKGNRYLDFAAGIAVNSLGHSHPRLVEALKSQAENLWHVSNLYEVPGQEELADRLTRTTFADKVFFTNSGAEALECAIKTARRYQYVSGHPERYRIITMEGAFHGRTLATIAAGGQAKYLEGFGPKVDGFDQVPFGDMEAVKTAIVPETAGILVEPVQGEGGIRPLEVEKLRQLRELCDDNGLLLILDEVQCGTGRTGKLFAHEWAGITPDILAVAKGIGGGFPLGACLATDEAAKGMTPGTHGTTYGGNPLAMAVGNAVMAVVCDQEFLDHVSDMANQLKQGLAGIVDRYPDVFADVRGLGLLAGLKCVVPNGDVMNRLRDHNVLTVVAGDNALRLIPPLTVNADEIRLALSTIETVAREIRADASRKAG